MSVFRTSAPAYVNMYSQFVKEAWRCGKLTNSILWWQVNSVCVEVLQEGSVHQVWELVNFNVVLVRFIQQCPKMLTPGEETKGAYYRRDTVKDNSPVSSDVF